MPTELEQQIPRFAEALDRDAPALSVEEILSRGTVGVDVDRLDRPWLDQVQRVAATSWRDATTSSTRNGEHDVSIKFVPTAAEPPVHHRLGLKAALAAAAAAVVLVVALAAIVRLRDEPGPADVPPPTLPAPPPTTQVDQQSVDGESIALRSGEMWPQATLEEVSVAQKLADSGDPAYAWQIDRQLSEGPATIEQGARVELIDRFLNDVLGWEAYLLRDVGEGVAPDFSYSAFTGQQYLRCAPGRTNPLYPPSAAPNQGEQCAPTIDDVHYESVSVDLAQLDRQGPDGIWVVNRWRQTAPFVQADPTVVEAQGKQRLREFLAARLAGKGAEGLVAFGQDVVEVPLLYATTSGTPYERYEIERVGRSRWPDGSTVFSVRLFADTEATMVEQAFLWHGTGRLWIYEDATTENGQPVYLSRTSSDGEVTVSAPTTWSTWLPGKGAGKGGHEQALDVWFGGLWHPENSFGSGERIELVDPVAYDAWCAANGGSPLLSAPANAAAIAQQLIADPNFETTAPVAAQVGGVDAVSIDVALAPGGSACGIGGIEISRWVHGLWEPGWRLRLYLVDLPEGMSFQTLAITVVAPDKRFDEVIAETAPIIESIEFHPG